MLTNKELTETLHAGVREAESCTRFCTYGASVEGDRYRVYHNGLGSRDTDTQVIYASDALSWPVSKMTDRLKTWVANLHRGVRSDLNAALEVASGDPADLAEVALVLGQETSWSAQEAAAGLKVIYTRGPAMAGWPWHTSTPSDHFAHLEHSS